MPLADPSRSFDAAARHLIRHLAEPHRLRINPLVRRFFKGTNPDPIRDRAAAAAIREIVRHAAARYRRSDVESALGASTAHRRHAIAMAHILGRSSLKAIAAELNISMRQCYRERLAVVRNLAKYVSNHDGTRPAAIEVLSNDATLFLNRADCFSELGDLERALRAYDDIVSSCAVATTKVQALCHRAELLLKHGHYSDARKTQAGARALVGTSSLTGVSRAIASSLVSLVDAKLSWATGRYDDDQRALEDSLARITPIVSDAPDRAAPVYAKLHLEFCERHRTRGEFGSAHRHLVEVENALKWFEAPPALRFDAMMVSWRLGGKSSQFEGITTRQMDRYAALLKLADLSKPLASTARSLDLALAFMQYYADAGRSDEAARWSERALAITKSHPERLLFAQACVSVADWLSVTPDWSRCSNLLKQAEGKFHEGAPDWIFLQGLWSSIALNGGRHQEAMERASAVASATEKLGSVRYQAAACTTVALAAHALHEEAVAKEQITAVLMVVDQYGTPWTQAQAYRAAADITGNRRHRRKADALVAELRLA